MLLEIFIRPSNGFGVFFLPLARCFVPFGLRVLLMNFTGERQFGDR
jgi:hypothetical protein